MIKALRSSQRQQPGAFADGLREWIAGEDTEAGEAAGLNVAELLILAGQYLTDGKWSK